MIQKSFKEKTEKQQELEQEVMSLQNEVNTLEARLKEIGDEMNSKKDSMTSSSPIKQLQDALTDIRNEIRVMDLRIGIASQSLMRSALQQEETKRSRGRSRGNTRQRQTQSLFGLNQEEEEAY